MKQREGEKETRCPLPFPVGVFGSHHPLLPHLLFSPPSFLLPSFLSISHEDMMFDLVVYCCIPLCCCSCCSAQTPGQKWIRLKGQRQPEKRTKREWKREDDRRACRGSRGVGLRKRDWLDKCCRIKWHERCCLLQSVLFNLCNDLFVELRRSGWHRQ